VIYEDVTFTYQELNNYANALAHILKDEYKIQPEEYISILMEKSEWIPASIIGILKAGGAYVPIDPTYPIDRMKYILKDTGCRILLSDRKHISETLPNLPDVKAIDVEGCRSQVAGLRSKQRTACLCYLYFRFNRYA